MDLSATGKRILRAGAFRLFIALGIILAVVIFISINAGAETVGDIVAAQGCAMAHCDQGETDTTQLSTALSGGVVDFWHDTEVNGSLVGLGCVSNSVTAVCAFRNSSSRPIDIRAYANDGTPLWSSTALSQNAFLSAPMIGPDGEVIAADENVIIRFDSSGGTVWSKPTAGGLSFSPNVTDSGEIVVATRSGPVSAYDFDTGSLIAELRLDATIRISGVLRSGYFDTVNTPAIRGNRIYISTQFSVDSDYGRLYALDLVEDSGNYSFVVAWYFEFRGPSGTSPTLDRDDVDRTIIYFDGDGLDPTSASNPQALAVTDMGDHGELLWGFPLSTEPQSSPALDPRGGIWYFAFNSSILRRIDWNGNEIQTINVNSIVDDNSVTFKPFSVMTISVDADSGHPVMIVAATNPWSFTRTYVIAIDLVTESLLWQYRTDQGTGFSGGTSGQYAMMIKESGDPVIVFSTRENGVWGLVLAPSVQPYCVGDHEPDGDVDGVDIDFLPGSGADFMQSVQNFGRADCPAPPPD